MPRAVRTVLHALSYGGIEVEASRKLADLKKMDPMRIFYRTLDAEVYNGDYKVPIRLIFFQQKRTWKTVPPPAKKPPVILFFHGGGWVTESVENYQRVCARMAQSTGQIVASVEYRLAPEYRFPVGLMDCYAAAKTFYTNRFLLNTDPDRITIMGDSAGGNLVSGCMYDGQRPRRIFSQKTDPYLSGTEQLLYGRLSFESVNNGTGYLLTAEKMEDYLKFYESCPEDRRNPYFAPILEKNFRNMPDTLILTAEFDPLRDEGEAFGEKLKEAGKSCGSAQDRRCDFTGILHWGSNFCMCRRALHM